MNLPNKLTVLRVIMVPFFVFFMLTGVGGAANKWIALIIFCVASLTDMLDGKIARARNLVTNFGKFMDPLADKLLVCSAMICMIPLGKLQAWFVIVIIAREFIISGFRLIASDNGVVIAASYWGKFKTVSQMVMIILLILIMIGMCTQERFFCQFLCPMGAVFAMMPILPSALFNRNREKCPSKCGLCRKRCPAHLEIDGDTPLSGECICCHACQVTCPRKNIQIGPVKEREMVKE